MENDTMTTKQAAVYCGLSVRTIKWHIYEAKDLAADFVFGGSLAFRKSTLDLFLANRRSPGRPALPPSETESPPG